MSATPFTYAHDTRASGRLAVNIMHFGRVLRQAGMKLGPASVVEALDAALLGAIRTHEDFYWTLHCVLVKRREDHVLFDQAFHVFWQKPKMLEELLKLLFIDVLIPTIEKQPRRRAATARLAEAYAASVKAKDQKQEQKQVEIEASHGASSEDTLRHKDFEQMSVVEQAQAKKAIGQLKAFMKPRPTHRFARDERGCRIDLRQTLRLALRSGGEMMKLAHMAPKRKLRPLVVLCDISGSCTDYSRMFLHFLHGLSASRSRLHIFTFGSRLTNITRDLARRDVDEAVARVSSRVQDWSGGTRMGASLKEFNFRWARRVLGGKADVLLMTDGLERDDIAQLGQEMLRLKRSAGRVIWLNPLLRFDQFAAKSEGIRAIMPHVDQFRPVHSLDSLSDLAQALSEKRMMRQDLRHWMTERS